jgi:hypothetical protein
MKNNSEREPDLIQYRLEYSLNDDLPSERFFMATNPRDALSQLAYSCIKHIPVESLSENEQDCFVKAFSDPSKPFLEKPDLHEVPKPIPHIDFPEPEPPRPAADEKSSNESSQDDFPEDRFGDIQDTKPADATPDLQPKPDPAAEYKSKQEERLAEIAKLEKQNQELLHRYEKLKNKTHRIMEWFTPRIEIMTFEEHNRWADSWTSIEYPLASDEEDDSSNLEDSDIEEAPTG